MQTATREVRLFGRDSEPFQFEVLEPETLEEFQETDLIDESQDLEEAVCALAFQQLMVNLQGAVRRSFDLDSPEEFESEEHGSGREGLANAVQAAADSYAYGRVTRSAPSVPSSTEDLDDEQAEDLASKLRETHPHLFGG